MGLRMKQLEFASVKSLHETLAVLSAFPAEMSLATCIEEISKHIELVSLDGSITAYNPGTVKKRTTTACSRCAVGHMVGPYEIDGLQIVRCSKKCGYSEVVG